MSLINKKQEYQDQEDWSNDIQKAKGYKELVEKVEWWSKQKNEIGGPIIEGSYEIVFDNELGWCVDVDGSVNIYKVDIKEIPIQFRNVSRYFCCLNCDKLTSLKGCPVYVGINFSCLVCKKLISLKYCPKKVGDSFQCYGCGKQFTEEYIKSLCNVRREIVV